MFSLFRTITFQTQSKVLCTDTALFSHFRIHFRQAGAQLEATPRSGWVRGTSTRHSPRWLGKALGSGWGHARTMPADGVWLGRAHGQSGQGCGELETSPAGVSLGQGLMAVGGEAEVALGSWAMGRVGEALQCGTARPGGALQILSTTLPHLPQVLQPKLCLSLLWWTSDQQRRSLCNRCPLCQLKLGEELV